MKKNTYIFSLCGKTFEGYGNSAMPLSAGKCCEKCHAEKVTPARLELIKRVENTEPDEDEKQMADIVEYVVANINPRLLAPTVCVLSDIARHLEGLSADEWCEAYKFGTEMFGDGMGIVTMLAKPVTEEKK